VVRTRPTLGTAHSADLPRSGRSAANRGRLTEAAEATLRRQPAAHESQARRKKTDMQVGDSASRQRLVRARDIELFTELTGDRNPVHYDPDLAARSRFGGIVVQGGVTSGLLNALVAEELPGPGSVFLNVNWDFRAPVRPGDLLTARAEVTSTREDKPITTLATAITNQDGVVVLDGTVVVWRDPVVAVALSSPAEDGAVDQERQTTG